MPCVTRNNELSGAARMQSDAHASSRLEQVTTNGLAERFPSGAAEKNICLLLRSLSVLG